MRRILGLIALLALTSCTATKTETDADIRSDLRSALSLALETNLFIRQIDGGRVLAQFQAAHAGYLSEEARRQLKKVRESEKGTKEAGKSALCTEQLEMLSGELELIGTRTDHGTLAEAERQVEIISKKLIDAGAGR